jgi:FKBP-type peptidyl-prolyl cis-trans isomerase 2
MGEFEIIETSKDTVTIDSNHALAGKNLTFEVKIEKIK